MKKDKTNFIVAVVFILVAFLGFPKEVKNIVFVVGALIILIPAMRDLRREAKIRAQMEHKDSFVESKPVDFNQGLGEKNV